MGLIIFGNKKGNKKYHSLKQEESQSWFLVKGERAFSRVNLVLFGAVGVKEG